MLQMDPDTFGRLVDQAYDDLPEEFGSRLDNVVIVVEDWPDRASLARAHVRPGAMLLGFYHGVPLAKRGRGYGLVTPDKISIYRLPILRISRDEDDVLRRIGHTLRHEIAHHFGIDDDRLVEIKAY